ncbi:hypothetical protein CNMCM8980_000500 [Aspergillus fumigatiaffinis]|uniref:SH3 domain-containing protein n=1 Tax=Aspergillus fumigatiaffinis TaxID=340414 RepID=A0A8H4GXW1_9EURO|nr:hypothetical protein CNMCM6805_000351 [Aspergillus fumigatiaffinis]KAF4242542.1 hypothetical protein CNMCM8980_000500 [Aspergillus fumigatiaffinis]
MTSVTASLPVGDQGLKDLSQEAPGQSYDDGMYHPGNARLAVVADPSNEVGSTETKPIATANAMLDGHGSSESGMLRGTITDTLPDPKAAAVKPAALPSEVPLDLRQGHFDRPPQLIATMTTSTNASSTTTSSTTSYNSTIRTTLHTVSMPTSTRASSLTSASHATTTSGPAALRWETMTPGAQAGIVISAVSLAIILIGMIFLWLHRKKRALLRAVRGEEAPPPTEKQNPAYRFASNLNTSSTSTLVNVAEIFKASREKSPSINDGSSSIYSNHQPRSNLFTLAADKVRPLRGKKQPPDRRSRYSHGYAFAQEFEHVPPPPPTRLQKIVAGLYANGSSTVKTVTAPFKAQPPPQKDNASSTWSSMSSRTPYARAYDSYPQAPQFQPPCDISDSLDLVKVRSVSSGTVAMSNPAEISVDALAGRISGEAKRHQEAVRESSPSPSQSTTTPCQQQSPPPRTSREGSPAYSGRAPSQTQLEVPSVKLWTKQVYRVEMDFTSRSDGQLQVGEGQMVRLEQIFDDGWVSLVHQFLSVYRLTPQALCTLSDTEKQGLLPRACLSTWPIKERRHYASSSNTSERALGVSPTDSQSFRFYRQHSRPGTPKPGTESKPATESKLPSVKKQSISPTLSTFFRL